jgi:hypothetical protein
MFTYSVRTKFKQYTWRCQGHDAEHTDSWGNVDTVEANGWTGGVHRDPYGPEVGCDPQHSEHVPGGQYLARQSGASTTFGGAINIIGFVGGVTSTVSNSVGYKWTNTMQLERDVCGESGAVLDGNTRVRSME